MPKKRVKKKNYLKRKGKINLSRKVRIRKKSEQPKDSLEKAPTQMPRDNGLNMRIKIRRKTK